MLPGRIWPNLSTYSFRPLPQGAYAKEHYIPSDATPVLEINIGDARLKLKLIEVNKKECHGALQALDQTLNFLKCCSVCPLPPCCWYHTSQSLPDAEWHITVVPGEVWWWWSRRTAGPEWFWSHLLYARVWESIYSPLHISLILPLFLASFHQNSSFLWLEEEDFPDYSI